MQQADGGVGMRPGDRGWGEGLPSFFDAPEPAAIHKHAVLERYLAVFCSKAGARPPHEVVVLDGYAGAGAYRDGTGGSPRIIEGTRHAQSGTREIVPFYVEKNADVYAWLETTVLKSACRQGDVQHHLEEVLEAAADKPLFVFLDPYGFSLPMRDIAERLLARPQPNGRRITEVLVHFSWTAMKRRGQKLWTNPTRDPGAPADLSGVDDFLGGQWWREIWGSQTLREADKKAAIIEGWCERWRAEAPGFTPWALPVATHWGGDPLYHLVLLTEKADGDWAFADVLPKALEEFWRISGQEALFGDPDELRQRAVVRFRTNVLRTLDRLGPFEAFENAADLLEGIDGTAGTKELRTALTELAQDQEIRSAPIKADIRTWPLIERMPADERKPEQPSLF